jgi:acetolactate synthase-1/2/3 large subunit
MVRTGGQLIADALAAQGVDHVFSVPGESFVDVLDGLYALGERIRLVTCRFEGGAVNMAEAYAKLTGRCGVAMVTRGPGACHGAIGVHTAHQDGTPLVMFVGQIPTTDTDRDAFQEIDYRRMFGSVAKWVTQIDKAGRVPELIAHAFDVACSGRPGPVVVAIPEDMQRQHSAAPDVGPIGVAPAPPHPAALQQVAALLDAARRPLVIAGGGGWTDAGRAAIRAFAEAYDLPVTVEFRRQTIFDGTSPHYAGDLGVGSDPALVAKVGEADLILAIGTRLDAAVSQNYTLFERTGAPLLHVYPDAAEIGRVFRPVLGIACESNTFAVHAAELQPAHRAAREWTRELRALRETARSVPVYAGALNYAQVLRDLEAELTEDAIVTTDAGNFATWPARFIAFRDRQRYVGPSSGAMGYGVPAAVAAKLLYPDRMVIGLCGDGGFLMTGQEIATAVLHGVAPVILVCNNAMYGTIRMHQERHFPNRVSGTQLANPDFARYMESFGGHGERVADNAAFVPALRRALASGKPALIELLLDPEQITSRATLAEVRATG